jgi:mannose-6-phosphate isomerase-like protein (cupin superfamily)
VPEPASGAPGAIVLRPGEGRLLPLPFEGSIMVRVPSENTGGAWCQFEYVVPPRFSGPVPHYHTRIDEHFDVLEGALVFRSGNESVDAGAGSSVFVPRGVVHAFRNNADTPARMLVTMSPGGFEDYFIGLGAIIRASPQWPPQDMTALIDLNARFDTIVVPGK